MGVLGRIGWFVVRELLPFGLACACAALILFAAAPTLRSPLRTFLPSSGWDVSRASTEITVMPDATLELRQVQRLRVAGGVDEPVGAWLRLAGRERLDGVEVTDLGGKSFDDEDTATDDAGAGLVDGYAEPSRHGVFVPPSIDWSDQDEERDVAFVYRGQRVADAYDDVVLVRWSAWSDEAPFGIDRLDASITMRAEDGGTVRPIRTWIGPRLVGAEPRPDADGIVRARLDHVPERTAVVVSALFPRDAFGTLDDAIVHRGTGRATVIAREDRALAASSTASERRAAWVWEHRLELIGGVLALLAAGIAVLARLGRQPGEPVGHLARPPEALPPAVAYGIATLGRRGRQLVLPTLLDLVDRGFYAAAVTEPPGIPVRGGSHGPHGAEAAVVRSSIVDGQEVGGGRRDLVLAMPEHRPSLAPLTRAEMAVLTYFDGVIGPDPGGLGSLHLRLPEEDANAFGRWERMTDALLEASDDEFTWTRDLNPWRWALMATAVLALLAIFVLERPRSGDGWLLAATVPFVVWIGWMPSQRDLEWLDEPGLARHRAWNAYARWIEAAPGLGGTIAMPVDAWSRFLAYALAFGQLRSIVATRQVPGASIAEERWWAGIAEEPLAFLADSKLGARFGEAWEDRLKPRPSD